MGRTLRGGGKGGILVTVGFQELLEKIHKAGGDAEEATWQAARKGAKIMHDELKSEATAAGVPSNLTEWPKLSFQAERTDSGNRYACKVGWSVGAYDPKAPSDAHKVIFMNYGTPRRTVKKDAIVHKVGGRFVTLGTDRGYVDARGFIGKAKKKARPKVKKAQEEALKEILKGLE